MKSTSIACIGVALSASLLAGCGDPPQSHPATIMADRYRPRIGLIEFVVKDAARRDRVTAIYEDIEQVTFDWQGRRAHYLGKLFDLSDSHHQPPQEELETLFHAAHDESVVLFDRYVELQMAARENLTADEFARLDGVR